MDRTHQIMTYAWIVLVFAVIVLALFVIDVINSDSVRSSCRGFQYFVFQGQKLTEDTYEIELLNGNREIGIKSVMLGGSDLGVSGSAEPAEIFVLASTLDPTGKESGEVFRQTLEIRYDSGSLTDLTDVAECTGRVQ